MATLTSFVLYPDGLSTIPGHNGAALTITTPVRGKHDQRYLYRNQMQQL